MDMDFKSQQVIGDFGESQWTDFKFCAYNWNLDKSLHSEVVTLLL